MMINWCRAYSMSLLYRRGATSCPVAPPVGQAVRANEVVQVRGGHVSAGVQTAHEGLLRQHIAPLQKRLPILKSENDSLVIIMKCRLVCRLNSSCIRVSRICRVLSDISDPS